MINQSSKRQALIAVLSALIPAAQTETHAVDEAAAKRLRINQTDLRCLGIILDRGPISASKLAETVGLTRAAMTTALDRLEKAGFTWRIHDVRDRRSIKVEATLKARDAAREIWEPIRLDGLEFLEKYSIEDLELLNRFFEEYSALQRTHAQRIQKLT